MRSSNATTKRRKGAADAFIEEQLAEGRVAFALPELLAETGLSVVAAANQLRRLGNRVRRVARRQAFFLIVEPRHLAMGAPPAQWWLDAYFRWLEHPYYLALLSAAESYGAAPQAVQVLQVMTDVPRRELSVGRLRIRFFVKRRVERTPVQQSPASYAPLRMSTPEATALDLVRYAQRIGGIGRARETLMPLLPSMRVPALRRTLDAEQNVLSAQRLGYLLERSGAERLSRAIHEWLPAKLSWCPLGPGQAETSETHRSKRWHVIARPGGAA